MSQPWLSPTSLIQRKIRRSALIVTGALLLLLLRLWYLQVLEGRYYATLSANNRLRLRPVAAPRGFILDRHGEVLVENRPSFDVYIIPADVSDIPETAATIATILKQGPGEVAAKIEAGKGRPYQPVLLAREVDHQTVVTIEERKLDLPGVNLRVHPVRAYPSAGIAAHLLGYVSEVNREQLHREEYRDFRPGEATGQAGVERRFEAFLRGIDGGEEIEVDVRGRLVRLLDRLEPQSGFNLVLTIDKEIQTAAEKAFAGKRGAVLAMNPQTGEILAWVSQPAYDPNLFAQRIGVAEWEALASNPHHPLQNRPLQALYPPGSVFKLVVMAAGLESGALTPETTFYCPGQFTLGNFTFDDWKKEGHGRQDLMQAIANSCNVYFYQAALRIGMDPIVQIARELGLGQPTEIGLGDEAKGLLPTPAWKKKTLGEPWYPGNTVMTAIGQGLVLATPLQLLTMVGAIANGGTLYRPWLVKRAESWEGEVVAVYGPEVIRRVNLSPETLALLRKGMLLAVEEGTGRTARIPGVRVAGKTGTAQLVKKEGPTGQHLKDHGWFVAFAPYEDPQIVLVVIAENAGFGSVAAAPVAKAIFQALFPHPGGRTTVAEGPLPEARD